MNESNLPEQQTKEELKARLRAEKEHDSQESNNLKQVVKHAVIRERDPLTPSPSTEPTKTEESHHFLANDPWEEDQAGKKTNRRVLSSGAITDETDEKILEGAVRRVHLSRDLLSKAGSPSDENITEDISFMGSAIRLRPYKDLGLPPGSTPEEIRQAYVDKLKTAKTDIEKQKIETSFDFLSDPQVKKNYDDTYNQLLQVKKLERQDRHTLKTQPELYSQSIDIDETRRLREVTQEQQNRNRLVQEQQKTETQKIGQQILEPVIRQLKEIRSEGRKPSQDEIKELGGKLGGLSEIMIRLGINTLATPIGSINHRITDKSQSNIQVVTWVSDEFGDKLL